MKLGSKSRNFIRVDKSGKWTQVDGRLKHVSVTEDGKHVWGVNKDDYIYYRNGLNGDWKQVYGRLKQVSVSSNGNHVWGVNKDDKIYYRNGVDGEWKQVYGSLKQVSVSSDGNHVWGVNKDDKIYYRNGVDGEWKLVYGRLKYISVSADGSHVYGVSKNDIIYYRNGVDGEWKHVDGDFARLDQVSVSPNGNHIWGVARDDTIWHRDVSGHVNQVSCSNVRFSQKLKYVNSDEHIAEDFNVYPVISDSLPFLSETNAVSVVPDNDCELKSIKSVPSFEELLDDIGGLPSHAPDDEFWIELEELISIQLLRREEGHKLAKDVIPWFPLPNLWNSYTMNEVAEVVRADFPGVLNVHLIKELLSDGLKIDNDILYQRCNGQFLHTQVMLSDMNTWAVGTVAPVNFRAKWYAGRARPEEVAWKVKNDECSTAPRCLKSAIDELGLLRMEDFTAYEEGAPNHPAWPAMHSAAASISMWLPVIANLTPEQLEATKIQDLAISMGRSIAGVHYITDNIDGLKMGQEVLARELPAHLEERYCADPNKVREKIQKVKFDWDEEKKIMLEGYVEQHHNDVC